MHAVEFQFASLSQFRLMRGVKDFVERYHFNFHANPMLKNSNLYRGFL